MDASRTWRTPRCLDLPSCARFVLQTARWNAAGVCNTPWSESLPTSGALVEPRGDSGVKWSWDKTEFPKQFKAEKDWKLKDPSNFWWGRCLPKPRISCHHALKGICLRIMLYCCIIRLATFWCHGSFNQVAAWSLTRRTGLRDHGGIRCMWRARRRCDGVARFIAGVATTLSCGWAAVGYWQAKAEDREHDLKTPFPPSIIIWQHIAICLVPTLVGSGFHVLQSFLHISYYLKTYAC